MWYVRDGTDQILDTSTYRCKYTVKIVNSKIYRKILLSFIPLHVDSNKQIPVAFEGLDQI